jgi:serine O-acetyltransferase
MRLRFIAGTSSVRGAISALSFTKAEEGNLLHSRYKRHPTLHDRMVLYATILGG